HKSNSNKNNVSILCTRPLPQELLQDAAVSGVNIDVLPFIETETISTVEVQQEIEQVALQSCTVVFTSMNAVEAVTDFLDGQETDWKIYALGTTTQKLAADFFGEHSIAGTASDATALAHEIVEAGDVEEVNFFCGDRRREELPQILKANGIEVNEITVYHTVATPHKINKGYVGILFFSPSAVDSFFSANKVAENTLMFAIGNTTAAAIKKYSNNKIIIADEPGKENLVEKAISYFS
ncbi:MAG: uroporphyrinogen-III synthase, partial [Chitinophagaceae bacterium]